MNPHDPTPCFVQRIGVAVPEQSVDRARGEQIIQPMCINTRSARLLRRLAPLMAIDKRHVCALDFQREGGGESDLYRPCCEQPHGPGMGARNAAFDKASAPLVRHALSSLPADELRQVGMLITASCTHASSPGLEQTVLADTPVPASVHRWNLGFMGCSAALAALRLVRQTQAPGRSTLIVACELSSLHFQYTDELDQMTANLLFADGAAAMLVSDQPSRVQVIDTLCLTFPSAADQMCWFADDHGLKLRLSPSLPETIATHMPAAVKTILDRNGLAAGDVAHWLVHPGGPQILDAAERAMGLPDGALDLSRSILQRYGNMSSPTILFILKEQMALGCTGPALAVAFGPGLTIELALLRLR